MSSVHIVDYGIGNVGSLKRAVEVLGHDPIVTSDPAVLEKADKIIVPGVGAFKDSMENFVSRNLTDALRNTISKQRPVLGICVGMQILFQFGHENGRFQGLGFLEGEVDTITRVISDTNMKVPRIGWYPIHRRQEDPLLMGLNNEHFYFVHSYSAQNVPAEHISSVTPAFGRTLVSTVRKDNLWGVQFHPERSGVAGLTLLRNFLIL